jgi:hypothetical protein
MLTQMVDPYQPITLDLNTLRSPIEGRTTIYSQTAQDLFVIAMTNGKQNGTYLEIGCGWPTGGGNNTFALEKDFAWTGISIDNGRDAVDNWRPLEKEWQAKRPQADFRCVDAFAVDYSLLSDYFDYLQIDIDPAENSLEILKQITKHIRFSLITFEHDWPLYVGPVREQSRTHLQNEGYQCVIQNIGGEDWWADPNIIDKDLINIYTQTNPIQEKTRCLIKE